MATDVERLIVALEARTTAFERAMAKANGTANRQARSIERRFQQMNRNLSAGFAGLGSSLTKAFAVAGGLRGMQSLLDSATRIDNALKVAGLSGAELEKVYNRLRDSALRNAAPLETLVTLYGRAALVQKELGVSQEEMLNFTDKIALALRVAGTDAQSASGALLQLSQALGSGVVRAEEFNSILEGALPIAQAAAAGLEEAGGSVARLRQLVVDGKVSSEAFFRAFEAGSVILEQKVSGATLTTAQGLTNVKTALIDATREFAHGSMAAETLGEAFGMMAERINSINFEAFGEQARALIGMINQIREAMGWLQNMGANLGSMLGTDAIGDWATGGAAQSSFLGGAITITNQRGVQRRIDEAFGQAVETAGALTEDAIRKAAGTATTDKTGRLPASTVTPVSLGDFAAPDGKGGGKGGGGRGSRADEYERLSQRIRESTDALNAETAAMAKLNPLVNDYGFAVEKARAEQELLAAAQKAGMELTPELKANVEALASAYANAEANAAKLREHQDGIVEAAGFVKDAVGGMVSDMIPAIETGNAALDKFLNTLIEAVAQATLLGKGPLAGMFGGGGLLSIFGLAKGGVVSNGRPQPMKTFARGGVSRTAAVFGEAGPEAAVPLPDGRRIPVDLRLPERTTSGSRGASYAPVYNIDARGADAAAVARLEAGLKERDRKFGSMVDRRVDNRHFRKTRA
jgi:tape measure domain-containing protein